MHKCLCETLYTQLVSPERGTEETWSTVESEDKHYLTSLSLLAITSLASTKKSLVLAFDKVNKPFTLWEKDGLVHVPFFGSAMTPLTQNPSKD